MNERLGALMLRRVPEQPKQPLRAWDAADELVLSHLDEVPLAAGARVLLVNDAFGALTCSLRSFNLVVINESSAGRAATAQNLAANELEPIDVYSMLDLDAEPATAESFDLVVIKIPKATAHLDDLLYRLRPLLHAETRVVGAAMVKHLHRSATESLETLVGPATASLAKKKARLLHVIVDEELEVGEKTWPQAWSARGHTLLNHGGGFSPSGLDSGTAMLLDTVTDFAAMLPHDVSGNVRAVDLGCGNGVIGLRLAQDLVASGRMVSIEAIDDSALAIEATRASWEASTVDERARLTVHHQHRMIESLGARSVDLIVVNPPFHDDRVVGDHTAWSMFTDAHKVLRGGSSLIVVGNRHLGYHAKLAKIFGSAEVLAANKKFVVLRAVR